MRLWAVLPTSILSQPDENANTVFIRLEPNLLFALQKSSNEKDELRGWDEKIGVPSTTLRNGALQAKGKIVLGKNFINLYLIRGLN
ncbi:hypothetical protein INP77_13275 [Methylophilus sp. 13]|uniref:hypothetical protein n=1 Tax=Methylophilus sp. 13 TaxID=2781018 RepID=UPI00188F8D38|nr:hypothetical protein [Methylophilus sp. 13]MBF5040465.1 hypothetical protein [Methylophilus sp. 13]